MILKEKSYSSLHIFALPIFTGFSYSFKLHVNLETLAGFVHEQDEAEEGDHPFNSVQSPNSCLLSHLLQRLIKYHWFRIFINNVIQPI